ncbi:MAG: hypothetical protein P9L99_17250 [Candidatus Lernaella stagnicola]|nr:hypothetical protein [Candidatus Lernaella stagnicola]
MRYGKIAFLFVLVLVVSAGFALAEMEIKTPDLPAAELAKVDSGEIYFRSEAKKDAEGKVSGGGLAVGYFKAPKDKIIDTILKYEDYPQFMPQVSETEVNHSGNEHNVKFTIKVFLFTIRYYMTHTVDREAGTVRFTLDKSKENDIVGTDGYWALKPYKEGFLVYYYADVDTGLKVPSKVQEFLTKRSLPKVVKAMKKRVGG